MIATNRRLVLLAVAIGSAGLASACGPSAAEQKAKFDEIQKKADDRVAQLEKTSKDQLADAQKQIADLQQKLNDAVTQAKADAKAEAEEEVNKAHAEADKLAAEAQKALARARAAYKDEERHDFIALSKQLDELRVKAAKAPAKTKPQIDKAMKDVVTKRDAAAKEIPEIDKATLETLRTAKAKVDQKMALLKQAIAALRAKLG
jgi:colicin import membrane protein